MLLRFAAYILRFNSFAKRLQAVYLVCKPYKSAKMAKKSFFGNERAKKTASDFKGLDAEVRESLMLIQSYADEQYQWSEQVLRDDAFRNGVQFSKRELIELGERRQPPVEWNIIYPSIELAKSILADRPPRFQAVAREGSDIELAQLFSDIFFHIWNYSAGDMEFRQHIDDYYVAGRGVWHLEEEEMPDGTKELRISAPDPIKVYPDPDSRDRWCRDAANILICDLITESQALKIMQSRRKLKRAQTSNEQRNPTAELETIGDNGQYYALDSRYNRKIRQPELRNDVNYYEYIIRYSRVMEDRFRVKNLQDASEMDLTDKEYQEWLQTPCFVVTTPGGISVVFGDEFPQVMELYAQFGEVWHYQQDEQAGEIFPVGGEPQEGFEQTRTQVELSTFELAMSVIPFEVTERQVPRIKRVRSIGNVLVDVKIMEIDEYPVVFSMANFNRNPYPVADVTLVRELQRYYNKMQMLILTHTANSAGMKVLVNRGADIAELEQKWGRAGAEFIPVDMEFGPPVVAQVPPLSGNVYANANMAEQKMQKILGVYDIMGGDNTKSPETYRATIVLEEAGQRRMRSKRESLEQSLNQLAHVAAQMIPRTYDQERTIRIVQPTGQVMLESINIPLYNEYKSDVIGRKNDIGSARFDLTMVSGSTLPSNRWARFEYYMQMFNAGLLDDITMIQQTDLPNQQQIIERKSMIVQLQQQVMALQEELKNVKGDLQTASRESLHDRKRVEVERFKTELAEKMAKIESANSASLLQMKSQADRLGLEQEAFMIQEQLAKKSREMTEGANSENKPQKTPAK